MTICEACAWEDTCTQVVGIDGHTHWCDPLLKGEEYAGEALSPTSNEQCNKFKKKKKEIDL